MPIVEVPGQGNVEFPDSMTDEQISAAIKKNMPEGEQDATPGGVVRAMGRQAKEHFSSTGHEIVEGAKQVMAPGFDSKVGGASRMFRGAASMVAPAAIPIGLGLNPVGTGVALGMGALGGKVAEGGANLAGAGPGVSHAIGDIGSFAGGGIGLRGAPSVASEELGPAVRGAASAAKAQVRPLLEKFSVWHPFKTLPMLNDAVTAVGEGASTAVKNLRDNKLAGPPPVGKPASRFDPSQYNSPQAVKPPVETGGAHIPDYQGPSIQPPVTPERTPIWKSAQEAAAHNEHLPEVTQGDEFKPPVVKPPVSAMPAVGLQTAGPGSVQPPAAGPQTPQAQPFTPAAPSLQPPAGNAPTPTETPANGKPILPVSSGGKVSGGETPMGTEIIKPGTQPHGEKLIPQAETLLDEQAKKHAELVKLFEEFKKRHSK